MKIRVTDGERNIRIWLPTGLVFHRLAAFIGIWAMKKYTPQYARNLTAEQLDTLFCEFRRIKAKYGSWDLVDVQSSEGQIVKIIL